MLYAFCRCAFALCVAYPVAWLWLGLAIRHRECLPRNGPAIVIANHNSHLDFLVLLTLFPLRQVPNIRTAAAADYFFSTRALRFISHWFLGLIPVERGQQPVPENHPAATPARKRRMSTQEALAGLTDVLKAGHILLLFPEGTRGAPESLATCKAGLWHLLDQIPGTRLCPVYLHGLGRSLPKGCAVRVPFFIDICIGDSIPYAPRKQTFMHEVHTRFLELRSHTIASLTIHDTKKESTP